MGRDWWGECEPRIADVEGLDGVRPFQRTDGCGSTRIADVAQAGNGRKERRGWVTWSGG